MLMWASKSASHLVEARAPLYGNRAVCESPRTKESKRRLLGLLSFRFPLRPENWIQNVDDALFSARTRLEMFSNRFRLKNRTGYLISSAQSGPRSAQLDPLKTTSTSAITCITHGVQGDHEEDPRFAQKEVGAGPGVGVPRG